MPNRKPRLYLMGGLPRAGKSTWVNRNKKDKIVIEPDDIRKEIFGHQFHANANGHVFALAESMVSILLKQKKDVIIDATNITIASRKKWKPIAEQYGAKTIVVWVYADRDIEANKRICLKRNESSPEGKKLPEDVIDRMSTVFETPFLEAELHGYETMWFDIEEYHNRERKKKSRK